MCKHVHDILWPVGPLLYTHLRPSMLNMPKYVLNNLRYQSSQVGKTRMREIHFLPCSHSPSSALPCPSIPSFYHHLPFSSPHSLVPLSLSSLSPSLPTPSLSSFPFPAAKRPPQIQLGVLGSAVSRSFMGLQAPSSTRGHTIPQLSRHQSSQLSRHTCQLSIILTAVFEL